MYKNPTMAIFQKLKWNLPELINSSIKYINHETNQSITEEKIGKSNSGRLSYCDPLPGRNTS